MQGAADRLRVMLPALWVGMLLAISLMAAPALFASLPVHDAGRIAERMFAQEANASLVLSAAVFFIERREARAASAAGHGSVLSTNLLLVFGALFCTVAGYFALLPMMEAARAGQGRWSFAALHIASTAFFGVKALLVLTLAWRVAKGR
jgi:hypothetical protein